MTRQIGKIKWFGGFNKKTGHENHFGFISRNDRKDLYVHRRDVRCSVAKLDEGIPVTFELSDIRGELRAVEVNLLQDETDLEVLAVCFKDNAFSFNTAIIHRYLKALPPEEVVAKILRRFQSLDQKQQDYWSASIIPSWLTFPQSMLLYPLLPFNQQIELYKKCLAQAESSDHLTITTEIIKATEPHLARASNKNAILNRIPRHILYLPEADILRRHLSVQEHFQLYSEIYEHIAHANYILEETIASFEGAFAVLPEHHQIVVTRMTEFFQSNLAGAKQKRGDTVSAFIGRLPTDMLFAEEGKSLRRALLASDVWQLYLAAEQLKDPSVIGHIVKELTPTQTDAFWMNALPKLSREHPLFNLAPASIKKQWLQAQFPTLPETLRNCILGNAGLVSVHEWVPANLIKRLTDQDRRLASAWLPLPMNDTTYDAYMAQMLSARMAELAAQRFYRMLGFTCKDVAITQLNHAGEDWKTHDLLLNNRIPIDVKNARTPYHDNTGYVEHCIPRFKKARNLEEVTITGVLSPYLTLADFENPDLLKGHSKPQKGKNPPKRNITVLGELAQDKVRRLQEHFTSSTFAPQLLEQSTFPSWLFDFPERYYNQQKEYAVKLRAIAAKPSPSWEEIHLLHPNPLPAFIAANAPIPDSWRQFLTPAQQTLYDKLCPAGRNNQRVSLPFLYLTILKDFLGRLQNTEINSAVFSPEEYELLLYSDVRSRTFPLGIVDPLDIIPNLIETLTTLWQENDQLSLKNIRSFQFLGLGLLRGRAAEDDNWTTLLAYCGGRTKQKVKCGKRPLIYGREQTCPTCKRLICSQCGFCQQGCPEYSKRREDSPETNYLSRGEGYDWF